MLSEQLHYCNPVKHGYHGIIAKGVVALQTKWLAFISELFSETKFLIIYRILANFANTFFSRSPFSFRHFNLVRNPVFGLSYLMNYYEFIACSKMSDCNEQIMYATN